MSFKKVQDLESKGKRIFLRADLDVPLSEGKIQDTHRLDAWFPTLELLSSSLFVTIAGHLGRPKGRDEAYSLLPIANWLAQKLQGKVEKQEIGGFDGWKIGESIFLLENLRFYEDEEQNNPEFAKKLASLAEIYVNDAFASSHRAHASIVGIPKLIPGYAGLRFQKEVEELSKVTQSPQRPLTIIVGGAKIETKLPLISKMHKFADNVLIGGELAEHTGELAKVEHEKVEGKTSKLFVAELTPDREDINEEAIQKFKEIINNSNTVVWNGPLGEFEKCFDLGTREIAKSIINTSAYSIVGGGDTVSFINKEGMSNKFSFVSTGGGAMLEFLAGEKLPGIEVLEQ